MQPVVLSKRDHCITANNISRAAKKVLKTLQTSGFQAYLVGGCVRDLLLGHIPKDFDVVTNAHPDEVQALFLNCRLIGRRFRLAHVYCGSQIIEVATFRANLEHPHMGFIQKNNAYGQCIKEDASRRDFTINALYYNLAKDEVCDYVGGIQDLHTKTLRFIGDPQIRYEEDPVRILRAIRFSARLDFKIEPTAERIIFQLGVLLKDISPDRLFEEYIKLFFKGTSEKTFDLLNKYELMSYLCPSAIDQKFVRLALQNTDQRVQENKPVSPGFLMAVFLWTTFLEQKARSKKLIGEMAYEIFEHTVTKTLAAQKKHVSVPRRLTEMIQAIWYLQRLLCARCPRKIRNLHRHRYFRAAYDFLLLRAACEETKACIKAAAWWTHYNESDDAQRDHMILRLRKA